MFFVSSFQRWCSVVSICARKKKRRSTDSFHQPGAQRYGAQATQAPHRFAVHRSVPGIRWRLPLRGGRFEYWSAGFLVSRCCGHRQNEGTSLRLHCQTSSKYTLLDLTYWAELGLECFRKLGNPRRVGLTCLSIISSLLTPQYRLYAWNISHV